MVGVLPIRIVYISYPYWQYTDHFIFRFLQWEEPGNDGLTWTYSSVCPTNTRFVPVPVRVDVPPTLAAYAIERTVALHKLSKSLSFFCKIKWD